MGRPGPVLITDPADTDDAASRAALAERAVVDRSVRRLWGLPRTALGVNSHPSRPTDRLFLRWNYWWQAHLLDCMIDAQLRAPRAERLTTITRLIGSIRRRNGLRWTNAYYDDMAWLGLALERAGRCLGIGYPYAVRRLTGELLDAWSDAEGGGIPWRRGDEFKNTPANGPAAILQARTEHPDRAAATADWIDRRLRDPHTGLIWDGLRPGDDGSTRFETRIYSYCQGVVLGAELELARRSEDPMVHAGRIHRLVEAVADRLTMDGVLIGHSGGDSGLFTGILARYLAVVGTALPGDLPADDRARRLARTLVVEAAKSAWANAAFVGGLPIFGPRWNSAAQVPDRQVRSPERDLSVQLSGWMLLEAAHVAA